MKKYYIGLIVLAVVTLGLVGFTVAKGLSAKQDKVTEKAVADISRKLNDYVDDKRKIPESLDEVGIKDVPSTIKYEKLSSTTYRFCATFKKASSYGGSPMLTSLLWGGAVREAQEDSLDSYYDSLSSREVGSLYMYSHKAGENCQTVRPYSIRSSSYYDDYYDDYYSTPAPSSSSGSTAAKSRDTQRVSDINNLHAKLEEYYNENGAYPQTFTAATFPGISSASLIDSDGVSIVIRPAVADEAAADKLSAPGNTGGEYAYVAFPTGCTNNCTGYVLKTFIESPTANTPNPYRKEGLNNP